MLLIDKLKQAKKNLNVKLESTEDIDWEDGSSMEVCSDPSEYGLTGTAEELKDSGFQIDLDPDDSSIFDSVSDHDNEVLTKNWEKNNKVWGDKMEEVIIPTYLANEEHVQENGKIYTKYTDITPAPTFSKSIQTETPKYSKSISTEDTSGNTESNVSIFLEKYAEGNDAIQVLRYDLMKVLSDMHWIKESGNENEQFALAWADALNEISVSI